MTIRDLQQLGYREAWRAQESAHAAVLAGGDETILLVEHPPVITMGRRGEAGGMPNLIASADTLTSRGVEIVQSDRGGDITFHGPGQIVAYPIIRLADHGLTPSSYVHRLEATIVATLAHFRIASAADPKAPGVWTNGTKIAAVGVRIRRGVSLHGLALNVTTDLSFFDLIVPCGLADKAVTSMQVELGERCPAIQAVKTQLTRELTLAFK